MGPPHRSFWNSCFGVDLRLRDASQEDGPRQWSLSLESDGVQAVVHIWKAWQEHHKGVSNSFPGFSTSTSSLEGDLWFTFPGSEAREGGAEPWLLSSLIFPFMASCTNSRISRGSLLNLSWYSCSSSICSWETSRENKVWGRLRFSSHAYRNSFMETCDGQREYKDLWSYSLVFWREGEKQFNRTCHSFPAESQVLVTYGVISLRTWTMTNTTMNTHTFGKVYRSSV